jgi:hypothetical protein
MRAPRAADAEVGEDVRAERQAVRSQDESLRLLPYSEGSAASEEVRQIDRHDRPPNREVTSPSTSHTQQEAPEPRSHNEVAEAERLLKSLASALALRLLGQAARKTRQAIAEAKRAMKRKDSERIRQANERLRESAIRLAEAIRRVSAATATDEEERSPSAADVVDAELEPTTAT